MVKKQPPRRSGPLTSLGEFLFESGDVRCIALFRIVFGSVLLLAHGALVFDVPDFYSDRGLVPSEVLADSQHEALWSLLHWFTSPTSVRVLHCMLLLATVLVLTGTVTRVSTIVLFLLLVSFRHRNPLIANSGDQLTTIVAFWLIFADSGRVWAVDALMRTRDRSGWNRTWALRCLQIQFCMIYFVSFVQKLGDDDWTSGTTMFYVLTNVRMWTVPLNGLLDYPLLLKTVTYATLVLEATLPFLIWHRRTRYVWITLSALFHSSIGLLLGIPAFSLYMLSMLTLFIPFTANASASASSANSRSRGPTLN